MIDLPVLRGEPTCPAALPITGTSRSQRGVVCREMLADVEEDPGVRMTPRQLEVLREQDSGIFLNLKSDPSTVSGFCHGGAVPVVTSEDRTHSRASYTYCPVWQAARDRHLAGLKGLVDEPEPESVGTMSDEEAAAMSLVMSSEDPAGARRALDELAPARSR